MSDQEIKELYAMIALLAKKVDTIEKKAKGVTRSAPLSKYLEELRKDALKLMRQL